MANSYKMTKTIRDQIIAIRDEGYTNMFDYKAVEYYANEHNFYELINYIEEDPSRYSRFILTGGKE